MFERWNEFVEKTQERLNATKPRGYPQPQPEQKKKQGKATGEYPTTIS